MATVFVAAHSLTTSQLRNALRIHRQIVRNEKTPEAVTTTDCKTHTAASGGGFVTVEGPEAWSFHSVGLFPEQARRVSDAIEEAA